MGCTDVEASTVVCMVWGQGVLQFGFIIFKTGKCHSVHMLLYVYSSSIEHFFTVRLLLCILCQSSCKMTGLTWNNIKRAFRSIGYVRVLTYWHQLQASKNAKCITCVSRDKTTCQGSASTLPVFKNTYLYFGKFYSTKKKKRPWSAKLKPCRTAPLKRSKLLQAISFLWLLMWKGREHIDKTWHKLTRKNQTAKPALFFKGLMGLGHSEPKQRRETRLHFIYSTLPVISNKWRRLELLLGRDSQYGWANGWTRAQYIDLLHSPLLGHFLSRKIPNATLEKHTLPRVLKKNTNRRH